MNYEAVGRYLTAQEAATLACKARNAALYSLKRWADNTCNTDQTVALDIEIGQQLLRQIDAANQAFDAAIIEANSAAGAAGRPELAVRKSGYRP